MDEMKLSTLGKINLYAEKHIDDLRIKLLTRQFKDQFELIENLSNIIKGIKKINEDNF